MEQFDDKGMTIAVDVHANADTDPPAAKEGKCSITIAKIWS
jgi:hypothetical protein